MARWSDAMKFDVDSLHAYRGYLDKYGVYELGLVRGDGFYPKYIGKAHDQTLYVRLRQYFYASSAPKIPPRLRIHLHEEGRRNMVWFHVYETGNPAESERLLLARHRIGRKDGLYEWNRKYE